MVVLGFDFGMRYIGVAVGQAITKTATPLTALVAREGVPNWAEIQTLIAEWQPQGFVLGIPLNMDGTEQPITLAAKRFGRKLLHRFPLPLYCVDERLSTWEALQRIRAPRDLKKNPTSRTKTKKALITLNAMAAAILVEQWLRDTPADTPRE